MSTTGAEVWAVAHGSACTAAASGAGACGLVRSGTPGLVSKICASLTKKEVLVGSVEVF